MLAAVAVTVPPVASAIEEIRSRQVAERLERERAAEAERERRLAEERRVMTTRADSFVRAIPSSRLRRANEADLRTAVALVSKWRSDSAAARWLAAAERELQRRERQAQQARLKAQVSASRQAVPSPAPRPPAGRPAGATARCRDGTYSYSASRRGTCSHHGGVAVWY
jgi:hypothetical protein